MKDTEYPFHVRPLSTEEGGGFVIEYPDLPGCMSDGETIEEAIANGKDAVKGWIETCKKLGREVPLPNQQVSYSGRLLLRIPKYLHAKLANRAKLENVSLNSLVQTFIAGSLENSSLVEHPVIPNILIHNDLTNVTSSAESIFTSIKGFAPHTKH